MLLLQILSMLGTLTSNVSGGTPTSHIGHYKKRLLMRWEQTPPDVVDAQLNADASALTGSLNSIAVSPRPPSVSAASTTDLLPDVLDYADESDFEPQYRNLEQRLSGNGCGQIAHAHKIAYYYIRRHPFGPAPPHRQTINKWVGRTFDILMEYRKMPVWDAEAIISRLTQRVRLPASIAKWVNHGGNRIQVPRVALWMEVCFERTSSSTFVNRCTDRDGDSFVMSPLTWQRALKRHKDQFLTFNKRGCSDGNQEKWLSNRQLSLGERLVILSRLASDWDTDLEALSRDMNAVIGPIKLAEKTLKNYKGRLRKEVTVRMKLHKMMMRIHNDNRQAKPDDILAYIKAHSNVHNKELVGSTARTKMKMWARFVIDPLLDLPVGQDPKTIFIVAHPGSRSLNHVTLSPQQMHKYLLVQVENTKQAIEKAGALLSREMQALSSGDSQS